VFTFTSPSVLFRMTFPCWCDVKPSTKRNDRMLEMMSDAPTNAGKQVTSNVECERSQGNTKDSVFWLVKMMLCAITLHTFLPFVGPNVISDGPTNGFLISKFHHDSLLCCRRRHACSRAIVRSIFGRVASVPTVGSSNVTLSVWSVTWFSVRFVSNFCTELLLLQSVNVFINTLLMVLQISSKCKKSQIVY